MNCMAVSLGGWVLAHCLANSKIGIRLRTVFLTAVFTTLWEFHSIVQFVHEFVQRDCKIAAAIKTSFYADYKHEITSFHLFYQSCCLCQHLIPQRVG